MDWRTHLIEWVAVSIGRTIQIVWVFWVLLAALALSGWGGENRWAQFLIPLSWITLIVLSVVLAFRKHELSRDQH